MIRILSLLLPLVAADQFPVKVQPVDSQFWDVTYYDTYKVATNKALAETYLLYQRGTEIPSSVNTDDYNAVVEIPLEQVGLTRTLMVTFMEQIGARDKIAAFLTDKIYISSPCFAESVEAGNVAILEERQDQTKGLVGNDPPEMADMVAFAGQWDNLPFTKVIKVSPSSEKTNEAIFEWVKFFALFFNLEAVANDVALAASTRFDCIKDKSSQAVADATRPTLLWGRYSDWCKGWDVGECPNYYCEYAEACSVDILSNSGGEPTTECPTGKYLTLEQFVEYGKNADYWFYPDSNWNTTFATYGDQLADFKSVQSQHVFDYQGMGKNSWFEQRFAEYYNVQDDMCATVGTRTPDFKVRHFWRNVFTEPVPADGVDAECTAESAANILADPHECGPTFGTSANSGSGVFGLAASIGIAAILSSVALLF